MTVDPNEPQGELPITDPPNDPPTETPPAAPAGVNAEEVADLVIAKLMNAAQTSAPEAQTQTYQQQSGGNVIDTLRAQAADPTHPLHATAVATLQVMRSQGEEQEWAQLGCPPGHPARALFAQNPQAYNGFPRFAFTAWELNESKRGANDRAREAAKVEADREAAKAARDSTPSMPSRSVSTPAARAGRTVFETREEFNLAAQADPTLDERYDRGEITIRTI